LALQKFLFLPAHFIGTQTIPIAWRVDIGREEDIVLDWDSVVAEVYHNTQVSR